MMRKLSFIIIALLLVSRAQAQEDGLNLPTELYVLTNSGQVQQYGVGMAGLRTVTPEDEFVLDFGVAPEGNWLAYRTEDALKLLNMYTEEQVEIEGASAGIPPVRGHGDTLAWSPTGDVFVYTTAGGARAYFTASQTYLDLPQGQLTQVIWSPGGAYLAAEAEDNIWWLYRREGENLVLTSAIPSAVGLTWVSPTQIAFAPGDGGLIRMDLAAANAQTVLLDNTWEYDLPYLLPDGTLAVFGRQKDAEDVPQGSGRLVGLAASSPSVQNLSEAVVELNDLQWAPGGNLLIAFRGGVMALVLPMTGQGLTLPISDAVAYSWGPMLPQIATGLTLPADGFFITEGADGIKQVWRLPQDGSPSTPITTAEADVTVFAVSPNQRNIAYFSGGTLWLQPLTTTGEAAQIAEVRVGKVEYIAFSTDGTRVAYDLINETGEALQEAGIWLVSTTGGEAAQVLVNGEAGAAEPNILVPYYSRPQFSPNVNGLLVTVGETETTDIGLLDLSTREIISVTDVGDFDEGFWLDDGRMLAIGRDALRGEPVQDTQVAAITLADNTQRVLASLPYPVRVESAREIPGGKVRLALGSSAVGPQVLNIIDLDTSTGALTPAANGGFMVSPQLSPDGTFLAGYTRPDGPLIFRNLTNGESVAVNEPPNTRAFIWGS